MSNRDRVIKVAEDGKYNDLSKFKVKLQQGGVFTFFGQFKAKEGEVITYQVSNEKYRTAKLLSVEGEQPSKPKYDTSQSILRQVAFKGAIELVVSGKIDLIQIKEYTQEFHNLLNS